LICGIGLRADELWAVGYLALSIVETIYLAGVVEMAASVLVGPIYKTIYLKFKNRLYELIVSLW
jgi:hypothetical protein